MTIIATIKAIVAPTIIGPQITSSVCPIKSSDFFIPTPKIIGIAKRKEKREASVRDSPRIIPPAIVAPERETPGKRAAIWNKPI